MIAVVSVAGVKASGSLKAGEFRPFAEGGGDKQAASQQHVNQTERGCDADEESFSRRRIESDLHLRTSATRRAISNGICGMPEGTP